MQFVYSLGGKIETKKKKKTIKRIWGLEEGVERDKSRGTGGPNSNGG